MNVKQICSLCILFGLSLVTPLKAQDPKINNLFSKLQTITSDNAAKISLLVPLKWETKDISMSPNGEMIAEASQISDYDFSVSITNVKTGDRVSSMQGRMDDFLDMVWSPDNKRIAIISGRITGSGVEEQTVKTYTIAKGANPAFYIVGKSDGWYTNYVDPSPNPETNPVKAVWNPSSNLIAVAFYEKLEVYNGDNPSALFSQPVYGINDVSWSTDGKFIVAKIAPNNVSVWGIQ